MKMNEHEQRMCEEQSLLFEMMADAFPCSSSYVISRFMNSDIAKRMDKIDDPYNYNCANNIVCILKEKYPSLTAKEGEHYSKSLLRWIGYVFRAWSIIKRKSSYDIYKDMKADDLLSYYDSFHTFSIEYCIDRLEEIVKEKKPARKSDYEIFKEIMLAND